MENDTQPPSNTTNLQINFRNGGFLDAQDIMGYQVMAGMVSILNKNGTAELFPIDTIQNITISKD